MSPPNLIIPNSSSRLNTVSNGADLLEIPRYNFFEVQAGVNLIPAYRSQAQLLFALQPHPSFRVATRFSSDFSSSILNATLQLGPTVSPNEWMRIHFMGEGGVGLLSDDRIQVGRLQEEVVRNGVRFYLGATVQVETNFSQVFGLYVSASALAAINDNLTTRAENPRAIDNANPNELLIIASIGLNYGIVNRRISETQELAPQVVSVVENHPEEIPSWETPPAQIHETFVPYRTYRPLLEQTSEEGPIYATSYSIVPHAALDRAGTMLREMLLGRPDVVDRLRRAGAIIGVFGRDETSCDLPYTSPRDPCTLGGLGGVRGNPFVLCAEANLMSDPQDRYNRGNPEGENVCVHELGHLIMNVGLTELERSRIRARFNAVRAQGRWSGDHAMENADEFFAEMTQSYFCANPSVATYLHTHTFNCPENLSEYDPETFALLDRIFRHTADLR